MLFLFGVLALSVTLLLRVDLGHTCCPKGKLKYSLRTAALVPQRDMPKHTSVVEQTTQDQNHTDANASLPTSDDQASKSLTDSVGANMETATMKSTTIIKTLCLKDQKLIL